MWLSAVVLWACAILILYEFRFPLPLAGAWEAFAASCSHVSPLLSWRGLGSFTGSALGNVLAISVFLALQAAFLAAGLRAGRWLGSPGEGTLFRRLSCLLAGWIVAAVAVLGLGLAGLGRGLPLALLAAAFLLGAPGGVRALAAQVKMLSLPIDPSVSARFSNRAALFVLALAAVSVLSPQTGADSLGHHLGLPARLLETGKLVSVTGNFFHDLPALGEMLFTFFLALGGERAMRLASLGGLAAAAGLLGALAAARVGALWGRVGFALAVTCPFLLGLARDSKPDILAAPLAFASLAWLIVPRLAAHARSRSALVAGALAGAAAAMQLSVLGVAFPGLVLFIFLSPVPGRLRRSSLFAAGACATLGPWLVRSFLLTGDPVYPFGAPLFPGAGSFGMSAVAVEIYRAALRVMDLAGDYSSPLAGPVSMWTATFADGLSPLMLGCLPLSLAALFHSFHSRAWWVAGIAGWAAWFALAPRLHLAAPAYLWLGAASLLAAGELAARRPLILRTLTAVAVALVCLQTLRSAVETVKTGGLLAGLGLEERRSFFNRTCGSYARCLERLARLTPAGSRVLVVGDCRIYPRTRSLLAFSPFEAPSFVPLIKSSGTPEELASRMRQLNVTYIVHNHVLDYRSRDLKRAYGFSPRDLSVWAAYWRGHARLLEPRAKLGLADGGFYLYRLGKRRVELNVTPTLPGISGAFGQVEDARRQGDLRGVAEKMGALESIVGDFPEVMFFIGDFWSRETPYKSWSYFRRADGAGYRDLTLWRELAFQAEDHWRLEEALKYHEKIYAFEPAALTSRHRRVLVKLSDQAHKLRRPELAERYLRRAVILFPRDPVLWAELSGLLLERNNRVAADGALVEALRLAPGNAEFGAALNRLRR